ncbi:hypothetical protein BDN72DRAFT_882823 [Pluteus cervinus]|uniref:Uncharacterized protein n=1 Tax=Pluteus cervinus TaxID=181527 RepID=A0ACD3A8C2_9AGAR|nr:hypothetical protein BDN72DRAFT_882823 [Pluteus cervinus]
MAFIHLVVVIMPLVPLPAFPFDASISPRENTVAGIWEKMMRYSFILVCGTVGTGKTTLAGLIQKHAQKVLPSVTLISLINWPKNPQRRSEVRARLNRRLGLPTIFILTSAELSYDDIDLWLDFLKNIHDHQPKNFYAIVFESYGYTFSNESVPESVQDSLRQCARRGWLHSDPVGKERVGYVFASPLHQWFVQWKLFSQIAPENALGATLLEFVLGVVRLFNPRRLPEHVRRNGPGFLPRPPETQFQDEFYRCSHIYSSGSIVTFPELGSTGHADFYVPSKKWGIEVFRHGDQLGERIGRFSQHGVYHPTYDLDDFIILHFHTTELEDKSTSMELSAYPSCDPGLSNVYHVVFQEGYRRVVVMDEKKQTVENGEFMLIDR